MANKGLRGLGGMGKVCHRFHLLLQSTTKAAEGAKSTDCSFNYLEARREHEFGS